MVDTFQELISFIKNPVLEEDKNTKFQYRLLKFWHFLVISLLTSLVLILLIGILDISKLVSLENHAMENVMEKFSLPFVFLLTIVLAPLIEESIFRAPLAYFKKKKPYKIAVYTSTLLFGFIHITNFEITTRILIFSPILVAPQVFLGFYLAYIRGRFGLLWAIALHATFNGILMLPELF